MGASRSLPTLISRPSSAPRGPFILNQVRGDGFKGELVGFGAGEGGGGEREKNMALKGG